MIVLQNGRECVRSLNNVAIKCVSRIFAPELNKNEKGVSLMHRLNYEISSPSKTIDGVWYI